MYTGRSGSEYANVEVDASGCNHGPYLVFFLRIAGAVYGCPVSSVAICGSSGDLAGGPSYAADEVAVGVGERLHALSFLLEVPAADRLVVANGKQVLTSGVED